MIYVINGCRLKEKVWYRGVITECNANESWIIIVVKFNKDKDGKYVKKLVINENENSAFAQTMKELDMIDEFGRIDTEELLDTHVKATLKRGKDKLLYVNRICIDEEYYDELEESGEAGEEEE